MTFDVVFVNDIILLHIKPEMEYIPNCKCSRNNKHVTYIENGYNCVAICCIVQIFLYFQVEV